MKRAALFVAIPAAAFVFALIARPASLGMKLKNRVEVYTRALSSGDAQEARSAMSPEMARGLSAEFLSRLSGTAVPSDFRFDGRDGNGFRMAGAAPDGGSRIVWFSAGENGILVTKDTAVDNILGSAVMLCRENAVLNPDGCCPVSGRPYECDDQTGTVICPEGHLGDGLAIRSDDCALRRDSVAAELSGFLAAGYPYPDNIEEMYTLSDGEYGRRGGYRCPDNGYKYYELRDGAIYCPFHEESSAVVVTQ
jgi:hypothetical protein